MKVPLRVDDMRSYLAATGWHRRPDEWRGASLWEHPSGHGALVPPRDKMDDSEERAWELLDVLSRTEHRPPEEIAEDIATPTMDTQSVRTFPRDMPSGFVSLGEGLRALTGMRNMFAAAARSETEGVRFAYRGNHPAPVGAFLAGVQLGPTKPGSYTFTARTAADTNSDGPGGPDGSSVRRTTQRLYEAVTATNAAITSLEQHQDFSILDDAVSAGVSANLCEALSDLAGSDRRQPFEIGFRWAWGRPSSLPATVVPFGDRAGHLLRVAARRLWQLDASGEARITGSVESLHDDPRTDDRWRVRVRGEMVTAAGAVREIRTAWLRVTQEAYSLAADAHLRRATVRAIGRLTASGRRTEISVRAGDFEIL